jgi:hypothetical protein
VFVGEGLSEREVLKVFVHLAFLVGYEARAAQMVRVIVVLLFFEDNAPRVAVLFFFDHLRGDALAARKEVLARHFAFSDDVVGVDGDSTRGVILGGD